MRDPRQRHRKRHRDRNHLGETFETCTACARDRAVCSRKIRLHDFPEAWAWMLDYNLEHHWEPPGWFYRCCWCQGFHLKTARTPRDLTRVEKVRRKHLLHGQVPVPAYNPEWS